MIGPCGLYIISRVELKEISYIERVSPNQNLIDQRPRVLIATVNFFGRDVWVANTCLDWADGTSRASALDFLFSTFSLFNEVVFMGDFNFDDGAEPESGHVPFCDGWVDTWKVLQPSAAGHTWDPNINSYAHDADPNSQPSRIDRIFLKSQAVVPTAMTMVGTSDESPHFGLLLTTDLSWSTCLL